MLRHLPAVLSASLVLGSCATLPTIRLSRQLPLSALAVPIALEGPSGPLSASRARAASGGLAKAAPDSLLDDYLGLSASLIREPLIVGNSVDLLVDGPQTYAAMFDALRSARSSIDLQSYIFDEVEQQGTTLSALLAERIAAGVAVRILVDGVGSLGSGPTLDKLAAAGASTCIFNPVAPSLIMPLRLNHRDHRKIVVVDGTDSFAGGINFSRVYRRGSARLSRNAPDLPPDARLEDGWRDTHVRIRGPGARRLAELFADTWSKQNCEPAAPPEAAAPETVPAAGATVVQIIPSSPDSEENLTYLSVIGAVAFARESIAVTMAYFVPDEQLEEQLMAAVKRGVRVDLILPAFSDFTGVFHAGRAHYATLLAAGVRIHEQQDAFLHAKTVVIDGIWSTVGSTNWDWRSFVHNDEVSVVVIDETFATRMQRLFNQDLARSREITAEEWEKRPWHQRFNETFWTGFERLL